MGTLPLVSTVLVTGALLVGLGGGVAAHSDESDATAFPTGSFVAVENNYLLLEFNEDGTGFGQDVWAGDSVGFTYATVGDLYTEMANNVGVRVPATYYWDFDGEHLTMELWGEDLTAHRNFMYAQNTWAPMEDPVPVVTAAMDFEVGDRIRFGLESLGFVPAAEVEPGMYTKRSDVRNRVTAVAISRGQPITPDLLDPPVE